MSRCSYSAVIPCVDAHERKKRSIEIVLKRLSQWASDALEIVCVVMPSSDGTEPAVRAAQENDPRIRLVNSENRLSRSEARNLGAENAEGERLLFMDDDCLVLGSSALSHLDSLDLSQSYAAGACRRWLPLCWDPEDVLMWVSERNDDRIRSASVLPRGIKRKTGRRDLHEYSFVGHFGCIERAVYDDAGGFCEDYTGWGFEDTDLMMRLAARGVAFNCLFDHVDVVHLTHAASESDMAVRSANVELYQSRERARGVHFHVNRLFGVFDDAPAGPVVAQRTSLGEV